MDFRTTILPHRDRLFRLALGIIPDTAEAEDIVQDTMLRAWERRSEWPDIQNVEAWLTQICKNLALDHKKRIDRNSPLSTFPKTEERAKSTDETRRIETLDSLDLLHQLVNKLPPPQDDIFRLRDIEGLSYREIAIQLQLTEDQVRVYLHRARQQLRKQYSAIQNFGL